MRNRSFKATPLIVMWGPSNKSGRAPRNTTQAEPQGGRCRELQIPDPPTRPKRGGGSKPCPAQRSQQRPPDGSASSSWQQLLSLSVPAGPSYDPSEPQPSSWEPPSGGSPRWPSLPVPLSEWSSEGTTLLSQNGYKTDRSNFKDSIRDATLATTSCKIWTPSGGSETCTAWVPTITNPRPSTEDSTNLGQNTKR